MRVGFSSRANRSPRLLRASLVAMEDMAEKERDLKERFLFFPSGVGPRIGLLA